MLATNLLQILYLPLIEIDFFEGQMRYKKISNTDYNSAHKINNYLVQIFKKFYSNNILIYRLKFNNFYAIEHKCSLKDENAYSQKSRNSWNQFPCRRIPFHLFIIGGTTAKS